MAQKTELELREILLTTGLVQPVKVESRGGKVSALCREVPGQGQAWLRVVAQVLSLADGAGFSFHMCRRYTWRDGALVFGWYVGIDAKSAADATRHIEWLREAVRGVEPDLSPVSPPTQGVQSAQAPRGGPEVVDPAFAHDLEVRKAKFESRTTAGPRPPDATNPDPPQVEPPVLKVIQKGTTKDQKNRTVQVTVEEFPLPHVFTDDMNKPTDKDKGAKYMGG